MRRGAWSPLNIRAGKRSGGGGKLIAVDFDPMGSPTERAQLERWVAVWQQAGPALDEQRRRDLEQLDTPDALRQLAAAFALAIATTPPSDTSGLVEQQRIFQRLTG